MSSLICVANIFRYHLTFSFTLCFSQQFLEVYICHSSSLWLSVIFLMCLTVPFLIRANTITNIVVVLRWHIFDILFPGLWICLFRCILWLISYYLLALHIRKNFSCCSHKSTHLIFHPLFFFLSFWKAKSLNIVALLTLIFGSVWIL